MIPGVGLALLLGGCLAGCPQQEPGPGTLKKHFIQTSGYFTTTPYSGYSSTYGSYGSTPTTGSGTPFGPPVVALSRLTCADDQLQVYVETSGWTADGLAFVQDTTASAPQPGENHTLVSFEFGPNGQWDHLERVLPVGEYDPDRSTGFTCDDVDQRRLTWGVEVFDINGDPADCVVDGEDPTGWVSDQDPSDDTPDFDPSVCRIAGI